MTFARSLVDRARSARAALRRRRLAERLLRAGLIDREFLGAQLAADFASDEEAALAWADMEPRLQYAPHPLIEPAWMEEPALSGADGRRRTSAGPQLTLPGKRDWVDEAAAAIANLEPTSLLPAAPGVPPITLERARAIALARAREFARQNARSLRRHSAVPPSSTASPSQSPRTSTALPLVSVIMPVRDREAVVGAAIDSVLAQRHERWELIVVDDGSTDGTRAVVAERASRDGRIRLIPQQPTGVSVARNRGISEAAGQLVAFLDSDNTWTPDHLAAAVEAIGDGTRRAVHTVVRIRRGDGGLEYAAEQVDRDALLEGRNAVDLNALVVGREPLAAIGGFDESLRRWVDYDLVLRLAERLELWLVPVIGVDYDHRLDAPDRITTRESPRWRRTVLERALVDWEALRESLPDRVDGASVVLRSRRSWLATLETLRHLGALDGVIDVTVVDAASPRAETGILALAVAGEPSVTVLRTAWDGGISLSAELALSATRGRTVIALEPGARPSTAAIQRAVASAAAACEPFRSPSAGDGILLAARVESLVDARGLDLVDDPLASLE